MSGNIFKSFAVLGVGTLGLPLADVRKLQKQADASLTLNT